MLKPGLNISFGLFISAEYKRSQNPDNYNITRQQLVHTSDQITENVDISSILVGIRL